MQSKDKLLQFAEEHPELTPLMIKSIKMFLKEKEAALKLNPNLTEKQINELLIITIRQCVKQEAEARV